MKHLSYEDRLIKLNLTTLERRRERGDIIQTYKMMHGLSDVNINELFTNILWWSMILSQEDTQKKCISNTLVWIVINTSSQRVITPWNKLSQKTAIAEEQSGRTISNTQATFAYHSFYDNLRLHVPLSTF